jgi:hypothetical protein
MKTQNNALSIDSAAAKILALLEKDAPRPARRSAKVGRGIGAGLARSLEIPPELADGAGDTALAAMQALKHAVDAGSGGLRQNYLVQAQRNIAALDPARYGTLVRHLQARVPALQGRGGDTRLAHVTPGELVIPERLQTPDVMGALRMAAMHAGGDPGRLEVGSGRNSINPKTGEMEFAPGLMSIFDTMGGGPSNPYAVPLPKEENPDFGPDVSIPPGVSLRDNMQEAAHFPGTKWYDPRKLMAFANKVRPGGDWDYKTLNRKKYENFGNVNYQATGAATGIPDYILRPAAGVVQMIQAARGQGPWQPSWGVPFDGGFNGDEPKDQMMMDRTNNYLLTGRDRE